MENKEVREFANKYASETFPRYSFTIVKYFEKNPNVNHDRAIQKMMRRMYFAIEEFCNVQDVLIYQSENIKSLFLLIRDNFIDNITIYAYLSFRKKVPSSEKEYSDFIYKICMKFLNDSYYLGFMELFVRGKGKVLYK